MSAGVLISKWNKTYNFFFHGKLAIEKNSGILALHLGITKVAMRVGKKKYITVETMPDLMNLLFL